MTLPPTLIEAMARVVHPDNWTEHDRLLSLEWNGKPAPAITRAADVVAPSIARVTAAVALLPDPRRLEVEDVAMLVMRRCVTDTYKGEPDDGDYAAARAIVALQDGEG